MIQKFLRHPIFLAKQYHPYKVLGGFDTVNILTKYERYDQSFYRWLLVRLVIDNNLQYANGQRMIFHKDAKKLYQNRIREIRGNIKVDRIDNDILS